MTTSYLDSKRISGTTADREGIPAVEGGWKELGRTTLGSAGDTIDVSSFADKRYLMVLSDLQDSGGTIHAEMRLNADSGSNYAYRYNNNGGSDATGVSTTVMALNPAVRATPVFSVGYLSNLAIKEKLHINHSVNAYTDGAGTAPYRQESVNKHAQTTNPISDVQIRNGAGTGDYAIGSEAVVLGWDPEDTHTTNFWEELASVDLSGGAADTLSTGTFTAKKYLWIQYFAKAVTDVTSARITFNSDTGSNYARRQSVNGGADGTGTSLSNIDVWNDDMTVGTTGFLNLFMINNSATEKLGIGSTNQQLGSGAATVPQRREAVIKWANTSSQITEVTLTNTKAGTLDTPTILKVWGSD